LVISADRTNQFLHIIILCLNKLAHADMLFGSYPLSNYLDTQIPEIMHYLKREHINIPFEVEKRIGFVFFQISISIETNNYFNLQG
jgi:hypothetical protein